MARLAGLEPATLGLEGRCSIQMSYRRTYRFQSFYINGRGKRIRTSDFLLPKQARYQTALYPEHSGIISRCGTDMGYETSDWICILIV